MGTRVELGDGHHAVLRDPEALTVAQRRPFMLASANAAVQLEPSMVRELQAAVTYGHEERQKELLAAASLTRIDPDKLDQAKAAAVVALVDSWDLDLPLPQDDPSVIDQLNAYDYDRLVGACDEFANRMIWRPDPKATSRKRTRTR